MGNPTFNKETHTYTLGDKQFISVTQLMKKHGLAPDYSGVNQCVLDRKADYGTLIHKEIENYLKYGKEGFTDELDALIMTLAENNLICKESECIVHNDIVAGTIDFIGEQNGHSLVIGDYKTCVRLDRNALAWQLSIYAYLYRKKFAHLYGFHLTAGMCKMVEVEPIPTEQIDDLMECERNGEIYKQPITALVVPDSQIEKLIKVENLIAHAKRRLQSIEEQHSEMLENLRTEMINQGVKSFENDFIKITYVAPTTKESIDSKRLQKEQPLVYANYKRTSNVKDYVKVTLRA